MTSSELECGCIDANKVPKTASTPPVLLNTPLRIDSSLGSLTLTVHAPLEVVFLPAAAQIIVE